MNTGRTCRRDGCQQPIVKRGRESPWDTARRVFCSKTCADAHRRPAPVTATCEVCGAEFGPSRGERISSFRKRAPRYCGQVCNGRAKTTRAGYHAAEPHCAVCDTVIPRDPEHAPSRHARRRRCDAHLGQPQARPRRATPTRAPQPTPPRPRSPFGDRSPTQPWRPAGFAPTPSTAAGRAS